MTNALSALNPPGVKVTPTTGELGQGFQLDTQVLTRKRKGIIFSIFEY